MLRETLGRGRRRRELATAVLPLACAFLAACGGDTSSGGDDGAAFGAGLLHVARDGSILSYRIEGGPGRLELTGTQALYGVETMAVEPKGRFLFAGVASDRNGNGGGLASLAIDRRSGTRSHVADVAPPACEMSWWNPSPKCEWRWLEAGATRIVSMWVNKTCHDFYFDHVSHDFDAAAHAVADPVVEAADAGAGQVSLDGVHAPSVVRHLSEVPPFAVDVDPRAVDVVLGRLQVAERRWTFCMLESMWKLVMSNLKPSTL